jgi:hypothetical protein
MLGGIGGAVGRRQYGYDAGIHLHGEVGSNWPIFGTLRHSYAYINIKVAAASHASIGLAVSFAVL